MYIQYIIMINTVYSGVRESLSEVYPISWSILLLAFAIYLAIYKANPMYRILSIVSIIASVIVAFMDRFTYGMLMGVFAIVILYSYNLINQPKPVVINEVETDEPTGTDDMEEEDMVDEEVVDEEVVDEDE